jgi:hypothetical protein
VPTRESERHGEWNASFDDPTRVTVARRPGDLSDRRPAGIDTAGDQSGRFFSAEQTRDGTYAVTFTEEGIATFETALGIASDLGRNSRISEYSTIADIMERTATREDLSEALREGGNSPLQAVRIAVLRRKLRGSERPTATQAWIGHIGKIAIVLLFVIWTAQQLIAAVQDITAIPGLLLNAPVDILHPTAVFSQVGANISDAGTHFVYGVVGLHLIYIAIALIRPFARIYRKDQIIPGERPLLRSLKRLLSGRRSRPAGVRRQTL